MRLEIKYDNIFETYLNFIYEKVIEWITPADNYKAAEDLLAPFSTLLKETNDQDYHINIFTLNYDLVFEKVFNKDCGFLLTPASTLKAYGMQNGLIRKMQKLTSVKFMVL